MTTQPTKPVPRRKAQARTVRRLLLLLALLVISACAVVILFSIPARAARLYGPPAPWLSFTQQAQYAALLLWYDGLLTQPLDPNGTEQPFAVNQGETIDSVASHLQAVGLIRDSEAFRAYLIYAGLDTSIQAGQYRLSTAMSALDIAHEMQDATPEEVTFVVLPGWRVEEIAESLSTSGLPVTFEEFVGSAKMPPPGSEFLAGAGSVEGFLFPDSYIFSRTIDSADEMIEEMVRNFAAHLTADLRNGFEKQGLTIYQAVILASMVEREAVQDEEQPLIASVYLNRFRIDMKLDADPTVQYALGYNILQRTWWTNPLSLLDLQVDSVYNTYVYKGLPPTPIANPGMGALRAVAFPAETPYLFFRARCDGSGFHEFVETFDEHLQNSCP